MSNYGDIDGVIAKWAKAANSELFTAWADRPARYFHIPGDPPFECFQISIQAPEAGVTTVTARAVDTNDDTEDQMDQTWRGPINELDQMLADAVTTVTAWKARGRVKPDPTSPW